MCVYIEAERRERKIRAEAATVLSRQKKIIAFSKLISKGVCDFFLTLL
jgi:hypothetical protein